MYTNEAHGDEHLAKCYRDCDYYCRCETLDMLDREAWEELDHNIDND